MRILAVDLGTSSVRALVLDERAVPVPGALSRRPIRVDTTADGAATVSAEAYAAALVACLDELHDAGHLAEVALVATAAQWHSVVPVDAAGEPLGAVLTWLDSRAVPPPSTEGPTDPVDYHQRTGTWWHRSYWSVRLPWLRARSGSRPAGYTGLVEYVLGRLLGSVPMSISQASGTGLLDLRDLRWDAEALELAETRADELPALAPDGWRGRLRAEYARRWPALREAVWTPPTGDGAASSVGAGCYASNRMAVTVGTSAAVRLVQPAPPGAVLPPLPWGLWRYRVDHASIVTGVSYSGGGNLYAWAQRTLRLPTGPELEEELDRVGVAGVSADARLGGDRAPGHAPAGCGSFTGLSFDTTAVHMFAALQQALCRQIGEGVEQIESTLGRRIEIVLGGGAVSASPWLRRTLATTLRPRSVRYVADPEVGATGAALLATGRPAAAVAPTAVVRPRNRPGRN